MTEKFTQLLPEIAQTKPVVSDDETICWEAYDKSGSLIGYAFDAVVPEAAADIEETQEMDKYQILCVVDPKEYKVTAVNISIHPDSPEEVWAESITEPEFSKQYIGLTGDDIDLSPYGKIDAITEATLSSTWVTDAIRRRIEEIVKITRAAP